MGTLARRSIGWINIGIIPTGSHVVSVTVEAGKVFLHVRSARRGSVFTTTELTQEQAKKLSKSLDNAVSLLNGE